jgi:ADP-L-glycero-D-manno-heptose 6-epimerase
MRILVTGSKGFIAKHMIRALELNDHVVDGIDWGDGFPVVQSYDWVIHMGAISSTAEMNIEKIMLQNYKYSCQLLDECIRWDVNFQFSSSASVYGLKQEFAENSPVDPRTPYAWTKYMFEEYCNMQIKKRVSNFIQRFRYFNVYGDGEEHKGSQASPYCQFKLQKQKYGKIKLFENSDKYKRDFVPVETIVDTHMKFFKVYESGLWNVGTGEVKSFMDVAREIDAPMEFIPMPEILKNSYQQYTCADLTKLKSTMEKYRV